MLGLSRDIFVCSVSATKNEIVTRVSSRTIFVEAFLSFSQSVFFLCSPIPIVLRFPWCIVSTAPPRKLFCSPSRSVAATENNDDTAAHTRFEHDDLLSGELLQYKFPSRVQCSCETSCFVVNSSRRATAVCSAKQATVPFSVLPWHTRRTYQRCFSNASCSACLVLLSGW